MQRRQLLRAGAAGLLASSCTLPAWAAAFPERNLRLIVPVSAGGSADKLARTLAQKLSEQWAHRVVVENVPGGSSAIGSAQVAKAAPDGHTLLLGGDSLSLLPITGKNLSFDPRTAFAGVTKAVVNPQLLLVKPGLGVTSFAQFVALLKSRPGEVTLGLPGGAGSLQHLAVELLAQRVGARPNPIPFPGGGPVLLDLLGGHIDATLITLAAATEHVRAGKLVPLAVTTPYRSKALPQVPTLQELGVAGYAIESWQGVLAPAGTPRAVIDSLHRTIVAVLRRDDVSRALEDAGYAIAASAPQDVDRTIAEDSRVYAKVAADANIRI